LRALQRNVSALAGAWLRLVVTNARGETIHEEPLVAP